jgi:hypothetical protein
LEYPRARSGGSCRRFLTFGFRAPSSFLWTAYADGYKIGQLQKMAVSIELLGRSRLLSNSGVLFQMSCYARYVAKRKSSRGGARQGAGRPAELTDPVRITLGFERADIEALQRIGEALDRSVASLVREGAQLVIGRRRKESK